MHGHGQRQITYVSTAGILAQMDTTYEKWKIHLRSWVCGWNYSLYLNFHSNESVLRSRVRLFGNMQVFTSVWQNKSFLFLWPFDCFCSYAFLILTLAQHTPAHIHLLFASKFNWFTGICNLHNLSKQLIIFQTKTDAHIFSMLCIVTDTFVSTKYRRTEKFLTIVVEINWKYVFALNCTRRGRDLYADFFPEPNFKYLNSADTQSN